jgi:hypothetical protein
MRALIALCLVLFASFAMSQAGPPEGGGELGDWTFTIENLSGTTTTQIWYYDPMTGAPELATYSMDWVTGLWTKDGLPIQRGMLVSQNGTLETRTVSAEGSGVVRVTATYIGQGTPPELLPICIQNASSLSGRSSNYAGHITNGLGSPEVWSNGQAFSCSTPEKELRVIRINDLTGTGYIELNISTDCTVTGANGTQCRVDPVNLTVSPDDRDVQIYQADGNQVYFRRGAPSPTSVLFSRICNNNVTLTHTIYYWEALREIVPLEYGPLFSNSATWPIGLGATDGDVQGGPDEHWLYLDAFSYFPRLGDFNSHGTFEWTVARPPFIDPLSGNLADTVTAYETQSTRILLPQAFYDYVMPVRLFDHLNNNDAETTQEMGFKTTWADGVVGKSVRKMEYHHLSETMDVQSEVRLYDELLDEAILPVDEDSTTHGGWVEGGVLNHDFWHNPSDEKLGPIQSGLEDADIACDMAKVGTVASVWWLKAAVNLIAAGLDIGISHIDSLKVSQPRSGDEVRFLTGSQGDYNDDPQLYSWRLYGRPALHLRPLINHNYGANGYLGTTVDASARWEPVHKAWRILVYKKDSLYP